MPDRDAAERLSAELEAALVRELYAEYEHLNWCLFKRALRVPQIELSTTDKRLGRWVPEQRVIEISRSLAVTRSWGVVVEVLKHEMAHQYVHEVLRQTSETSHGPVFRDVCARLGVDGRATGLPDAGADARTDEEARLLERVARLLALAGSSNANEAQAAMSAAQRLMLKYNLDVAKAAGPRGYSFRHVGKPSGRVTEGERLLAAILAEHFFVEVIWIPIYRALEGKRGRVLEVCGTPANLEMAEYVHDYLLRTSEDLWRDHKRARALRSNRDRRAYVAGVMMGFLEKLRSERKRSREQGLVWVGDADLGRFYRQRHPHISHSRHEGQRRNEAHAHGREAGKKIVIHRPVERGPSGAGRLLPRGPA
jgi:hypothetical protein